MRNPQAPLLICFTATTDTAHRGWWSPDGSPLPTSAGGIAAQDEPTETFDRVYVQKLRDEAAGYRVRVQAHRRAQQRPPGDRTAALTGKLADSTELPSTDELLDDDGLVDEAKVHAAVEDLIRRKPHLAARRPTGVGQGARPGVPEIGLATLLRRGA